MISLKDLSRYPAHGFALPRSPLLDYAEPRGPKGTPVLVVRCREGLGELLVVKGPGLSVNQQRQATVECAQQVAARMKRFLMTPLKDNDRPDGRASFCVALTSPLRDGTVVTVAGESATFLLMSTAPAGKKPPPVLDLLRVQFMLQVLR